jgi:transposase
MGIKQISFIYLEATSWYGEDLSNFMHDLGHNVSMVNPAQIRAFG